MTSDPRCSSCSARLGRDAPWCTQCWAPVRPEPLAHVPSPRAEAAAGTVGPPGPPRHGRPAPTWPCRACGTANALELPECEACSAPFLVVERPALVLPGVGDVVALPRAQRLGAALLLVLLVVGGLAVLLALG